MIWMTVAASMLKVTLITPLALGLSLRDAGAQTKACGSEIQAIEINNATLHYFECGEGEPLVFVHGGLGDLHTFREQLQTFAARFRVIAYSRRYFPPNAPPRATDVNSLSGHVADLGALVKELKATPAHLVGNSYGAYIALALAVDHPELVRGLVLGEPPILPLLSRTAVGEATIQSWIRRVSEPSRKAFESGSPEEGLRLFVEAIGGTGSFDKTFPQSVRTELVEKRAPEFRSELMTERSAYMPPLNCGDLGKLERPTLLVTGERTHAMFLLITAELERCLEGESQVMVPEAWHTPQSENAAFYNQAVLTFLRSFTGGL
jgi:pimeloyl-ACP methyl ester carboxylesterase